MEASIHKGSSERSSRRWTTVIWSFYISFGPVETNAFSRKRIVRLRGCFSSFNSSLSTGSLGGIKIPKSTWVLGWRTRSTHNWMLLLCGRMEDLSLVVGGNFGPNSCCLAWQSCAGFSPRRLGTQNALQDLGHGAKAAFSFEA